MLIDMDRANDKKQKMMMQSKFTDGEEPLIIESSADEGNNMLKLGGVAGQGKLIPMKVITPRTLAHMQGQKQPQQLILNSQSQDKLEYMDSEDQSKPGHNQKFPSFGLQRKSRTSSAGDDDSIQLSLNGTMDKYNSLEIVRQLHAEGQVALEGDENLAQRHNSTNSV